ncbi:hypothetical protein [Kocuria sp. KH4]
MTDPAYQWPVGVLPGGGLPDVEDRLSVEDRGLALWVPLDFLDGYPAGSGYWTLTTGPDYRGILQHAEFPITNLGGPQLSAAEVRARIGKLLGLGFPHLTAVSYQVVRGEGEAKRSARFPAYLVH